MGGGCDVGSVLLRYCLRYSCSFGRVIVIVSSQTAEMARLTRVAKQMYLSLVL